MYRDNFSYKFSWVVITLGPHLKPDVFVWWVFWLIHIVHVQLYQRNVLFCDFMFQPASLPVLPSSRWKHYLPNGLKNSQLVHVLQGHTKMLKILKLSKIAFPIISLETQLKRSGTGVQLLVICLPTFPVDLCTSQWWMLLAVHNQYTNISNNFVSKLQ